MTSEGKVTERQFIRSVVEDNVAILTIDRPPVNALNTPTVLELEAALEEAVANEAVKVVVITGAGQFAFVAGADINEIVALRSDEDAEKAVRRGQEALSGIERCRKPVIAAINSVCLGGGNELAMACHLRIASDRARFGQPEINLGLTPGFGASQRLPRIVGKAKALELLLTGDTITAQEALRIGLINRVVPEGEVLKAAKDLARRITAKSQVAARLVMEAVVEGEGLPLEEGMAVEQRKFVAAQRSEDGREGVTAFLEKRQPRFKDR